MTLKLWRRAGDQFFDANGDPISAGTIELIESGTTNLIDLYSDAEGQNTLANPVLLNSAGRLTDPIYADSGVIFNEAIKDGGAVIEEGEGYSLESAGSPTPSEFALPKRNILNINSSMTLTSTHRGYEINCTATNEIIITLDAVTNWAAGHNVIIRHFGGSENIRVQPVNSETINGGSEIVITPSDKWARVVSSGSEWSADTRAEIAVETGNGLSGDGTSVSPLVVDEGSLKSLLVGPDVIIVGERSQIDGGEASIHTGRVKRYLNNVMHDRNNDVALADSVVTINRLGECVIKWDSIGYECGTHQTILKDITNDVDYYGSTSVTADGSGVSNISAGEAVITINAPIDIQIDHLSTVSKSDGFGVTSLSSKSQFCKLEVFFI